MRLASSQWPRRYIFTDEQKEKILMMNRFMTESIRETAEEWVSQGKMTKEIDKNGKTVYTVVYSAL